MKTQTHPLIFFFKLTRPIFLLGGIGQYLLGVAAARYFHYFVDWDIFFLGLSWALCMQLFAQYLNEYFDNQQETENPNRTLFSGNSGVLGEGEGKLHKSVAMVAAAGMLTIAAFITLVLISQGMMTGFIAGLMIVILLGSIFYSVPPVQLIKTGYGELTTAILVGNLVPVLAYTLQTGEMHAVLITATLPLTIIMIVMFLALEFPDYSLDLKYQKHNLLIRLGWQNAMLMHNIFIVFAFLILGLASFIGLPTQVAYPAFMALPFGLLQMWQMRRIAVGLKPNWKALTLGAVALFGVMSYMLTFSFWMR